ncbi:endoglucanase 10-like [Rutidosis leptorrhynchoides]|uniref:endoglucanase 10-like n=1 Tax=Rutidosis leptorrhynchoides TaxID=125765 RepID=UPI003A9958FF
MERQPPRFFHSVSEASRVLPSASRWNSIEVDLNPLAPASGNGYHPLPSQYAKSFEYELIIRDKKELKRFVFVLVSVILLILFVSLLVKLLPHKHEYHKPGKNLTLAVNQALTFFDAQKSGVYPKNSVVKFRGDSGLKDGNTIANLVGGFYDSGNNIKFTFPTAYSVTLLSWSVIEYHEKYEDIDELDHVKDIIKWGSDYLLKALVHPNSTRDPTILYSQVGGGDNTNSSKENDISCWQRPEDMKYPRHVSVCDSKASDLSGEIVAALSASSLVFKENSDYSKTLVKAAEKLFLVSTEAGHGHHHHDTYTDIDGCRGDGRKFYNSSGYKDELIWGGTWLFFATGNTTYLSYATKEFDSAASAEKSFDHGIFDWNNKLTANMVLLTRLRFFLDPGYPYEDALAKSSMMTDQIMCSYIFDGIFDRTPGGLILLRPDHSAPLQFASGASFLSKLYSDYLDILRGSGSRCGDQGFTLHMLRKFSMSQVNYILGENPMKMSYMVGFGHKYPTHVHHRGASIPRNGKDYTCTEGIHWKNSNESNPNILTGAMVGGPDQHDKFLDEREKPSFTQPSIASNAALVAALIASHDPPTKSAGISSWFHLGIDQSGIFDNIHLLV